MVNINNFYWCIRHVVLNTNNTISRWTINDFGCRIWYVFFCYVRNRKISLIARFINNDTPQHWLGTRVLAVLIYLHAQIKCLLVYMQHCKEQYWSYKHSHVLTQLYFERNKQWCICLEAWRLLRFQPESSYSNA